MIRRFKQVRAGLVRAAANAIRKAIRMTEAAADDDRCARVRAHLRLSNFPFVRRTYIISARTKK